VREHGIRVNVLCPGAVNTEFLQVAGFREIPWPADGMIQATDIAELALACVALPPNIQIDTVILWPTCHFTVCRYVERNALRANLVTSAEQWRWSSLWHRVNRSAAVTLADWPLRPGQNWLDYVTQAETEAEWKALRRSAQVGIPFGETVWQQATAKRLGLESTLRPPGRPKRLRPDR
jgi:hypothetical protein